VDEVNLLDDGLVDVVLDSAASGLNTVEREGVSIIHPAKFIMLGSGNPMVGPHVLVYFIINALVHMHWETHMAATLVTAIPILTIIAVSAFSMASRGQQFV